MTIKRQFAARLLTAAVIAALLACMLGCCETPDGLRRKMQLWNLSMEYHYFASGGRSPSNLDEFSEFVTDRLASPEPYSATNVDMARAALERLKKGELILNWNADLSTHDEESDPYVLGYEKGIENHGGYMMSGGGFVKYVSAEEFAEIPPIPTTMYDGALNPPPSIDAESP